MKVMGFNGSARKDGNTSALIQKVFEELEAEGIETKFHSLNAYFTIAEMIIVGSSYWNMGYGRDKGEVLQDDEGLQTMANLGKNMAWLIKTIEASKETVPAPKTSIAVITNFIR